MAAYSYNVADTKVTAQVNVTNLLDTTYHTDAVYFMPFTPGVYSGRAHLRRPVQHHWLAQGANFRPRRRP